MGYICGEHFLDHQAAPGSASPKEWGMKENISDVPIYVLASPYPVDIERAIQAYGHNKDKVWNAHLRYWVSAYYTLKISEIPVSQVLQPP